MAASINLSYPNYETLSEFSQEYEITVNLLINAADGTSYYLRGLFYKTGTNKYCGFTQNGQNWFNGPYTSNDGWKNLPSLVISSDSASTKIKAKLDADDNNCNVSGEYSFKIMRYTKGGSSNIDDQNEQKIVVNVVVPTATVKPTLTKTPVVTTVSKSKADQVTVKPSVTQVKNQSSAVAPSFSPNPRTILSSPTTINTSSDASHLASLSASVSKDYTQSTVAGIMNHKNRNLYVIPLVSGIMLIFLSSYLSFKKIRNLKG